MTCRAVPCRAGSGVKELCVVNRCSKQASVIVDCCRSPMCCQQQANVVTVSRRRWMRRSEIFIGFEVPLSLCFKEIRVSLR